MFDTTPRYLAIPRHCARSALISLFSCLLVAGCNGLFGLEPGEPPVPFCGDSLVQSHLDEECDEGGASDGCDPDCTFSRCGDGLANPSAGEACDDGNTESGDGCSADCRSDETCGNGLLDDAAGETCDDGNTVDGDDCSATCRDERCGDGVRTANEICDDGNQQYGDGCSGDCRSLEVCGNGVTDTAMGEQCDDATVSATCDADCTFAHCGDGHVNSAAGEQCDSAGESASCDADCSVAICGDGVLNHSAGEDCDSAGDSAACDSDCTPASCGDGYVNGTAGEICDDGGISASCDADCTPPACGDGVLNPAAGEQCDDGNVNSGDGCSASCAVDNYCGDGVLDAGEVCDDGNAISGDGCRSDCLSAEQCGNGVVDDHLGEQCDDDGESATCDGDCTLAICGDSYRNASAGESCDTGGNSASCDADCTPVNCGDGFTNPAAGEHCDTAGETGTCDGDCTLAWCGDGYHNASAGESCDTGGNSASCDADCTPASCGDGAVNPAAGEQCDDAGESPSCDLDCTLSICGDDVLNASAGEQCDDGGPSAGCDDDCTPAVCGDGLVNPIAGEQCDDGGETATCDGDCTAVECGDGAVNTMAGEVCDDGGMSASCDSDCTAPQCGDILVNPLAGEECDTGGDTLTCDGDCTAPSCGDGRTNAAAGETCDDGGESVMCNGDCTDTVCGDGTLNVTAGEECDDGNPSDSDFCTSLCEAADCRDGIWNADELDTDCGGQCRGTCVAGQVCADPDDCASGRCEGGTCVSGSRLMAGAFHTCALLDTGAVRCWGRGIEGQLGYGNTNWIGDNEAPSSAGDVDVGSSVVQLAAGYYHTCVLLDTGAVRCWGNNGYGQLGYGNTDGIGDDEAPSSAGDVDVGGSVVQLTAGGFHTCALLDTGAVRCWGLGGNGQLGYGNTYWIGDDEAPSSAGDVDVGGSVVQLTAGYYHTCALMDTGAVRCWGRNDYGQLGYGNTDRIGDNEVPSSADDVDVGGSVVQLSAGNYHTCALLDTGAVRCWGHNGSGQLGYGNTDDIGDNETPSSAGDVDVGGPVVQITVSEHYTCALLDMGAVRCWGQAGYGQLGYGNTDDIGDNEAPSSAGDVDVGGSVVQLTAGYEHMCALLDTGMARCWGRADFGQLGYGNTDNIGDDELPSTAGDIDIGGSLL